ncbi:hypothetical protein [Streptomyces sp. NBC_00879]|uniref:hypothetical protein n=1 Tax=Streptomyces sp. NBC_00879 TaxID=2975855 RepID=UPI00386F9367
MTNTPVSMLGRRSRAARPPIRPAGCCASRASHPKAAVNGDRPPILAPRTAQIDTNHATIGTGPSHDHHAKVLISSTAPPPITTSCAGV